MTEATMKKTRMCLIAAAAASLMVPAGAAFGQDTPDCSKANRPQMVEGQVTQVDMDQGRIRLRASDGTVHEFQASKETIGGYKIGDPIKAKLRADPRCN